MALRMIRSRIAPAPVRVRPPAKVVDPFYTSPEWRGLAARAKRAAGYRCAECGTEADGRALIADHVAEIRDGGARLDSRNIRVLCASCHQTKTAAARRARDASV